MSKTGKIDIYDCPAPMVEGSKMRCNGVRYHLSTFDKPYGRSLDIEQPITRTLKWKCTRGHITTTTKKAMLNRLTLQVTT